MFFLEFFSMNAILLPFPSRHRLSRWWDTRRSEEGGWFASIFFWFVFVYLVLTWFVEILFQEKTFVCLFVCFPDYFLIGGSIFSLVCVQQICGFQGLKFPSLPIPKLFMIPKQNKPPNIWELKLFVPYQTCTLGFATS